MRAIESDHRMRPDASFDWGKGKGKGKVKGFVQYFMNYGLIAAVLVWAAVVGLMAYHLDESPWRWAFMALSAGGIATVGAIIKIRKYINGMNKSSQQEHHS